MVSLDIYIIGIIPLDNYSLLELSVNYVKSKDNIAAPLIKGLNRELVDKLLRRIKLKPMKRKVIPKEIQPN